VTTTELVYELLLSSPQEVFEAKLRSLLQLDTEFALCSTSLTDVLFFWVYRKQVPKKKTKEQLSKYLGPYCAQNTLTTHRSWLLKQLAEVIGIETPGAKAKFDTREGFSTIDYHTASRALLAGIENYQCEFTREYVARDACLALYKCDFTGSFHSLQCLGLLGNESGFSNQLARFITRAEAYLFEIVSLYPSPILLWEKKLLQAITQKSG